MTMEKSTMVTLLNSMCHYDYGKIRLWFCWKDHPLLQWNPQEPGACAAAWPQARARQRPRSERRIPKMSMEEPWKTHEKNTMDKHPKNWWLSSQEIFRDVSGDLSPEVIQRKSESPEPWAQVRRHFHLGTMSHVKWQWDGAPGHPLLAIDMWVI